MLTQQFGGVSGPVQLLLTPKGTDSMYTWLAINNRGDFLLLARLGRLGSVLSPCDFTKTVFLDYRDPV